VPGSQQASRYRHRHLQRLWVSQGKLSQIQHRRFLIDIPEANQPVEDFGDAHYGQRRSRIADQQGFDLFGSGFAT
jgi:hypothetical protein